VEQWFARWSYADASTTSVAHLFKPDFLPGTTLHSMRCGEQGAAYAGVWEIVRYDRKHRIALAEASTDQCSVALFTAPPPPGVAMPDTNLTAYRTGRGIHIGSTYPEVISAYGGTPPSRPQHFLLSYDADVRSSSIFDPRKTVALPEVVTFVIDSDRVSGIIVSIDMSGAL
jgi:hypothetical protein